MRPGTWSRLAAGTATILLLSTQAADAQTRRPGIEERVERLETRILNLSGQVGILRAQEGIEPAARNPPVAPKAPVTTAAPAADVQPPPAPATPGVPQASPPAQPGETASAGDPTGAARVSERDLASIEQALITANALVLPPWALEIEPSFSYTHSSSDFISISGNSVVAPSIIVGEIVSQRVRRDSFALALTGRLGLPWTMQADLRVPFRIETVQTLDADRTETERDSRDLGDIRLGLSKQLFFEEGPWPDVLARVEAKSTTGGDPFDDPDEPPIGSGFWSLGGNLTFVKGVDPAVLFGSVGYTWNIADDKSIGEVDPGDTINLRVGAALALSNELSLNFGWDAQFGSETSVEGQDVPGTSFTTSNFLFGFSYAVSRGIPVDLNFAFGVTEDSPDVEVTFALPIRVY